MGSIVAFQAPPSLDETVRAIQSKWLASNEFMGKARKARIVVGQELIALAKRIADGEAGPGVRWWPWFRGKFGRSRKDAQKCIALAAKHSPELAHEAEKLTTKKRVQRIRQLRGSAVRGTLGLKVMKILQLMDELNDDERGELLAAIEEKYYEQEDSKEDDRNDDIQRECH